MWIYKSNNEVIQTNILDDKFIEMVSEKLADFEEFELHYHVNDIKFIFKSKYIESFQLFIDEIECDVIFNYCVDDVLGKLENFINNVFIKEHLSKSFVEQSFEFNMLSYTYYEEPEPGIDTNASILNTVRFIKLNDNQYEIIFSKKE